MMKDPYWWTVKEFRNRAVRLDEIREYIERLTFIKEKKDVKQIIEYLVRNDLAVRVVEDIYFIKDPFYDPPSFVVLARGLNKAGVRWYYGLLSAYMNGRMVQQGFSGEVVINNKYSGKRKLGGKKYGVNVYFVKTTREEMYKFGLEEVREGIWVSDPEKTILDFIYFSYYGTFPFFIIQEVVLSYFDPDNSLMTARGRNYRRMKEYLKYYPKFVRNELYGMIREWELYYYDKKIKEVFEV